ncbi:MAG: hypothetical protein Q7R51_02405 [bacterium]|nr:hypothetical protein [bacterium]
MEIIITILSAIMGVFGIIILFSGIYSKHVGIVLGGATYSAGAYFAYTSINFWPLIIAFALAWILRKLGANPS